MVSMIFLNDNAITTFDVMMKVLSEYFRSRYVSPTYFPEDILSTLFSQEAFSNSAFQFLITNRTYKMKEQSITAKCRSTRLQNSIAVHIKFRPCNYGVPGQAHNPIYLSPVIAPEACKYTWERSFSWGQAAAYLPLCARTWPLTMNMYTRIMDRKKSHVSRFRSVVRLISRFPKCGSTRVPVIFLSLFIRFSAFNTRDSTSWPANSF